MKRTTVTTAAATAGLAVVGAFALAVPAVAGDVDRASGQLTTYAYSPRAVAIAPAGSTARVQSVETGDGKTIMTLDVSGLESFAKYGAHAHVSPCGSTGGAAGAHFQWDVDPALGKVGPDGKVITASTDPAYANPENELWLDLTTNRAGEAHAKAVVDRPFPDGRRPGSVIIHEQHTAAGTPGTAGTAGKRVACLTLTY